MFRNKEIDHPTDKIDIRKSIISRIERVTNPPHDRVTIVVRPKKNGLRLSVPKLMDRTGHDSVSKSDERCHTSVAAPLGSARLDHASIEGRRRCSQTRGEFGTICCGRCGTICCRRCSQTSFRTYCAHSATKAYPGEIQTQKLLRHR